MLLRAEGIVKRYGAISVLDSVSLDVQENEVLGLLGPNGAGKTTLFECLAGLLPLDWGSVEKCGLFYLPDGIRPWPEETVQWALAFFESLYQSKTDEAPGLIDALQLRPLLGATIRSLSKGECKRLLLALSLLTPHRLLLLDEPFDGLDFRQTRDVMTLLRRYPTRGTTLFLSIHQLNDAARVCDRLILLSRGRVVGAGTLAQLQALAGLAGGGLEEVFLALT